CNLESGEVAASSGAMNPQIRFGEDLMSRVSYSMMHPGGAQQMTEAVRGALNALAAEVAREAKVEPTDILELTVVGNPIMHHLLLGIDPVELGGAPFALATDSALALHASELGLTVHPGARVYTLPCIAGELSQRSDRIVQTGRTYAYVVHRGTPALSITQNDVRAIQLAKAALRAGVALLMDRFGCDRVDRIRLAGAFGSHIDVKYAM